MTITHSEIQSPTGNRLVVDRPAFVGMTSQATQPMEEFLSWATDKREPQELEVSITTNFDKLLQSANLRPIFGYVFVHVTHVMGAGRNANSGQTDTRALLPDHGLKFRLAARALRIRLQIFGPVACEIAGAIAPVIGGEPMRVFPNQLWETFGTAGELIPAGATEFRSSMPRAATGATIAYGTPGLPPGGGVGVAVPVYDNAPVGVGGVEFRTCLGAANPAYLPNIYPHSYEWCPIPGEAYRFRQFDSYATVHFR